MLKSISDDWCLWPVVTFIRPAANFCKMYAWLHAPSSSPVGYILPLSSLGHHFRAVWNTASWAVVKWTKVVMVTYEWSHLEGWAGESWGNSGKKEYWSVAEVHSKGVIPVSPQKLVFCTSFVPSTSPLLQKLIYPSFPHHLLEVVSQGYLRCSLLGLGLSFAPSKTWLSTFRLCFMSCFVVFLFF